MSEAPRLAARPKISAVQEVMLLWAMCFAAIIVTFIVYRPFAKPVSTVAFLYLPLWAMRKR